MNAATDDDRDQENTLTSSDLRGLLKAASLTEFRSDAVSENSEETFVKSNSLFDLVRSNLIDDEGGKGSGEPEGSAGSEKITLADIKRSSHHKLENDEGPRPDPKDRPEDLSSISESDGNGSIDTEVLPETQNVVDLNPGNEMAKSLGEGDGFTSGEDTFERSTLVDDAKGVTTQERPIEESDEFQQELLKLQLKFDRQLEDEKQNLAKITEALFGASNFIAVEMEKQISDFVLSVASDLAGTKIDKLPAPFVKKIARVAKQIIGNENEVAVHLNSEDFKVVNAPNNSVDFKYKFHEKQVLRRGEFEVLSNKSTAGISLFDRSVGG